MLLNRNPLQRFLEKLTPSLARGYLLEIQLNKITPAISQAKKKQLLNILQEIHQDKKGVLLEGPERPSFFMYFSENKQDEISALLIKVRFNLGISIPTGNEKNTFYVLYQLQQDLEKVKQIASAQFELPPREESKINTHSSMVEPLLPVLEKTAFSIPFTPGLLDKLEKSLAQADLSNLMRRQAVCALVGNAQPLELFEEIYVALGDLKKALCPTVDIYQSPWLLDRLLETLDKRVLENICRHDAGSFCKNFSINIAVKTILSPDFQVFNESINPEFRQSILLEIKQSDIFSNLSAYLAAVSFVKQLGYRVCIDTVTLDSFPMLLRRELNADFIKLIWDAELLEEENEKKLTALLNNQETRHVILCRVDDKRAIEWGQKLGISLFQGYFIQKMLYQIPKKKYIK